jgi:hypothetical protein
MNESKPNVGLQYKARGAARRANAGGLAPDGQGKRNRIISNVDVPDGLMADGIEFEVAGGQKEKQHIVRLSKKDLPEGWTRALFDTNPLIGDWEVISTNDQEAETADVAERAIFDIAQEATFPLLFTTSKGVTAIKLYDQIGEFIADYSAVDPDYKIGDVASYEKTSKRQRGWAAPERYVFTGDEAEFTIGFIEDYPQMRNHCIGVWDGGALMADDLPNKKYPVLRKKGRFYFRLAFSKKQMRKHAALKGKMAKGDIVKRPRALMPEGIDILIPRSYLSDGVEVGRAMLTLNPRHIRENILLDWITTQNLHAFLKPVLKDWMRRNVLEQVEKVKDGTWQEEISYGDDDEIAAWIEDVTGKTWMMQQMAAAGIDLRQWNGLIARAGRAIRDQLTSWGRNERHPTYGTLVGYVGPADMLLYEVLPHQFIIVDDEWELLPGVEMSSLLFDPWVSQGWASKEEIPVDIRHLYDAYPEKFGGYKPAGGGWDDDDPYIALFFYDIADEGKLKAVMKRQPNMVDELIVLEPHPLSVVPPLEDIPHLDSRLLPKWVHDLPDFMDITEKFQLPENPKYDRPFNRDDFVVAAIKRYRASSTLGTATNLWQCAWMITGDPRAMPNALGWWIHYEWLVDQAQKNGGVGLEYVRAAITVMAKHLAANYSIPVSLEERFRKLLPGKKSEKAAYPLNLVHTAWDDSMDDHRENLELLRKEIYKLRVAAGGAPWLRDPRMKDILPFAKYAAELRGTWSSAHMRASNTTHFFEVNAKQKELMLHAMREFPSKMRGTLVRALMANAYTRRLELPGSPDDNTFSDGVLWFDGMDRYTLEAMQEIGAAYKPVFKMNEETGEYELDPNHREEWEKQDFYSVRFSTIWKGFINRERETLRGEPMINDERGSQEERSAAMALFRQLRDEPEKNSVRTVIDRVIEFPWIGTVLTLSTNKVFWVDHPEGGRIRVGKRSDQHGIASAMKPGRYMILYRNVYDRREACTEFFLEAIEFFSEEEAKGTDTTKSFDELRIEAEVQLEELPNVNDNDFGITIQLV